MRSSLQRPLKAVLTKERSGLAVALAQFTLFGLLTGRVRQQPIMPIDIKISRTLQKERAPLVRNTMHVLSFVAGKGVALNLLGTGVTIFLWRRHLRLEAAMLVATSIIGSAVKGLLQHLIDRPRPGPPIVEVMEEQKGDSFPSGHVVASLCFWGWLLILATKLFPQKSPWKRAFLSVAIFFLTVVGPVRIYLGDHWATDVVGGYLFGSGWLGLMHEVYLELQRRGVLCE